MNLSRTFEGRLTVFLPFLVAVSIAASGCRFSLPFRKVKSFRGILLMRIDGLGDLDRVPGPDPV
jgi:hypothetical protein